MFFYITHWIIKIYQDFLFQTAQLLIFIDLDKLNCLTDLEFLRLNLPSFNRCYTLNQPSSNRAVKSDFCRELLIVRPSLNILVIKWLGTLPSQEGVDTCAVGELVRRPPSSPAETLLWWRWLGGCWVWRTTPAFLGDILIEKRFGGNIWSVNYLNKIVVKFDL